MPKIKVAIIVEGGVVLSVYSDQENVEVEIIDLDCNDDEAAADRAQERADEVVDTMVEVA